MVLLTSQPSSPFHDVLINQLSQTDSMSESQVNFEPQFKAPSNQVSRVIPKVNLEIILNSKSKYPMRLSKESKALWIIYQLYLFLVVCRRP